VTERKRQDRGGWQPELRRDGRGGMRRVSRAGPDSLAGRRDRAPVGERVVQAHLRHFCPGGLGFPVTGSLPTWLGLAGRAPVGWEDNSARAAGLRCDRCGRPITPAQDVRRRADGAWVHDLCPVM
jgi:hypothetical protein